MATTRATIEFRPATDAASVHALMTRYGIAMDERYGLTIWRPAKPVRLLEPHFAAGETWEAVEEERLIATLTLAAQPEPFYDPSYFDQRGETGSSRRAVITIGMPEWATVVRARRCPSQAP